MASSIDPKILEFHQVPKNIPVAQLEVKKAFANLTEKEKLYSHHLAAASWLGSEICLVQLSQESPIIFNLLRKVFGPSVSQGDLSLTKFRQSIKEANGTITDEDIDFFFHYASCFFANMGNYLSFGDTKFVPRLSKEKFLLLVRSSPAYKDDKDIESILSSVVEKIYSLDVPERMVGFNDSGSGQTTYYSPNVSKAEIELVHEFMTEKKISPYNTRLFKDPSTNNLQLLFASSVKKQEKEQYNFKGRVIEFVYGDYSDIMKRVVLALQQSRQYTANDFENKMIDAYIKHFAEGSIEDFRQSQLWWVKNKGPTVETNIGFIESYRDPFGVRGEWEGFVAVVNKETSAKFGELVNKSQQFLSHLPWPREFEKDHFLRPDFTALEVVAFASSGIPSGINIPNLDDIRQEHGFKNVSLSNVISAGTSDEKVPFLKEQDQSMYNKLKVEAFEVQVGLHELLGHGSGKLLAEDEAGKKNFSPDLYNPLTNEPVKTWYKAGQTWDGLFLELSSPIEECRAELVGVYLSVLPDVLEIFGHPTTQDEKNSPTVIHDITYINWLNMARAGVLALEFYSPEQKKWRQAHMQARFGILRTMLEAGQGLLNLDIGMDDATISLDRSKVKTIGVQAVGRFLSQINIMKATADVAGLAELFNDRTAVPEDFMHLRDLVIKKKQPRKMFVQVETRINPVSNKVDLIEYESTYAGLISSNVARFDYLEKSYKPE